MRPQPKLLAIAALVSLGASGALSPSALADRPQTTEGRPCRPIAIRLATPFGRSACTGVRPGAVVTTDKGLCTMNFLFRGSDGGHYMGTAGHCVFADSSLDPPTNQEKRWAVGKGPRAEDRNGRFIGRFVYAAWTDTKDFALFRLNKGVRASAAMCHFGGPTGVYRDHASTPVLLNHFGNGLVTGDTVPARTSVAESTAGRWFVWAAGAAAPGDSGSGVITSDGRAIGALVAIGAGLEPGAGILISRLDTHLKRAEQVLKTRFSLRTGRLN